jgi:ascorbate-specific PTS system EIIC-type component UlaA
MTPRDSRTGLGRALGLLRRPIEGPLLLGLIFGGLPFAAVFDRLGGRVVSAELLRFVLLLTPIAILVAAVGALVAAEHGWKGVMVGGFLTSLWACVPLPVIVCLVLAHRYGYDGSAGDFAVLVILFVLWALAVAVSSWLLTFIVMLLKRPLLREGRPHV